MGHLSSAVSKWYDEKKTRAEIRAERSIHKVKFTPLKENELLKDFFTRLDSYFERIKASESNILGLLSNAIANDRIWETVKNVIVQKKSYELVKAEVLARYGKPWHYWLMEEINHVYRGGSLSQRANRYTAMLTRQVNRRIDFSDPTDPRQYMMIRHMMGQIANKTGTLMRKILCDKRNITFFKMV
jgi:hypothetical protein